MGRTALSIAVACLAAVLALAAATAQDFPPLAGDNPEATIGTIPGTDMLRDEFRARAQLQLKAVALSAHTHRLMNNADSWPTGYYELRNSQAWGFDLLNIFTGRKVQAIYFEPGEDDFTDRPVFDVPFEMYQPTGPTVSDLMPDGQPDPSAFAQMFETESEGEVMRVDPGTIRDFSPGDIYYYTAGDILQLVLFAPDGSYFEHVDFGPNNSWMAKLRTPGGGLWPDSILAAQLLYFTERMLPQYYNLVQFMGDEETIPATWYETLTPAERLDMAYDLGISILNPFTREQVGIEDEHSLGDFVTLDPEHPVPLAVGMRDGGVWTLDQLHDEGASRQVEETPARKPQREKPSRPPLGGM